MIQIKEENLNAAINAAGSELKEVLITLFGIKMPPKHYTDIKTFEDACQIFPLSKSQVALLDIETDNQDVIAAKSYVRLTIAARAMNYINNDNQIWYPDWSNSNECKYYPWMKYKSGSGFSCHGCVR